MTGTPKTGSKCRAVNVDATERPIYATQAQLLCNPSQPIATIGIGEFVQIWPFDVYMLRLAALHSHLDDYLR